MNSSHPLYIPPGGPPENRPPAEIYAKMGESNIFKMLEDLYEELSRSSIASLFPEDRKEAAKKSAAFFVFLLGGPPLYQMQYGAPRMRQRHLPFAIDEAARQTWLACFRKILIDANTKYCFPMEHFEDFWTFLERFSAWMVNKK